MASQRRRRRSGKRRAPLRPRAGSSTRSMQLVPGLSPELPVEQPLMHLINLIRVDEDPICVIRRVLNTSDANPKQARMQLPYEEARALLESGDVTAGEKELMDDPDRKLRLSAYDRRGNRYRMDFSKVDAIKGKNGLYRLTYSFAEFLRENELQEGDTVVMWVLRLPEPPVTGVGTLAMVLLDYRTEDEAELAELEEADRRALETAMAARGLLQLSSKKGATR